jgi:hypothetical protein
MVNTSEVDVTVDVFDLNRELQEYIAFLPVVFTYK